MEEDKKRYEDDPFDGLDIGDTIWGDNADTTADSEFASAKTMLDDAKAEKQRYQKDYTSLLSDLRSRSEERLAGVTEPLSQEELDKRRASGTLVSTIAGTLANLANGIAVGRGAQNATIPDGYTLAYEHWNDIEKRNAARQKEYDKLVDSIYKTRLDEAKAKYGEASTRYAALEKQMMQLVNNKMKNEYAKSIIDYRSEKTKEQHAADAQARKDLKTTPPAKAVGGKTTATSNGIDYRSFSTADATVSIPEDQNLSVAYNKLLQAAKAKAESTTNKRKKEELVKLTGISISGDNDKNAFNKVKQAVAAVGLTQQEIDNALGTTAPARTTTTTTKTKTSNQNNGGSNGRTRQQNNSGLF